MANGSASKWARSRKFFLGGVLGGAFATILLFIGTELLGFPFPPLAIFQLLIAPVPGSIQSVVVETFQEYAKYSAFVFSSIIYSALYGVVAVFVGFLFKEDLRGKVKEASVISIIIPTLIGLGLQLQLANAFPAISSIYGWGLATLLLLAVNFLYTRTFLNYTTTVPVVAAPQTSEKPAVSARRGFLKKVGIAAAVLVVAAIGARIGLAFLSNQPVVTSSSSVPTNPSPEPVGSSVPEIFSDPRLSALVGSEVTDNRVFYRVDIDPIPPQLDINTWMLKIDGKVSNPMTLTRDTLEALPSVDQYATLECVSNTISPPGGLISNAKWTGVQLAPLLKQAGVLPEAKYVVFHCGDGYTVGIPIERALLPDAVLAYKMNDEVLPTEHGFPLRAIVPGIYGMMNGKWITEIEVVDQVYLGYWQDRGWSNDARIKTTSIIYYPPPGAQINGSVPVAGVAFAGDRGISKVEVSTDGGSTWNEATLKPPRSPYSWVLWAYNWTPTSKGTVTITVRATDGTGTPQTPTPTEPFPDGGSGYGYITVTAS